MKPVKQCIAILVTEDELHLKHAYKRADGQIDLKKSNRLANTPSRHWESHVWIENQMSKLPEVPLVVVMEAAGMYHQAIINYLYAKGYSQYLMLPEKVSGDKQIPRSKSGKYDLSYLLHAGLTKGYLHKWEVPASESRRLHNLSMELVHRKRDLYRVSNLLKSKAGSSDAPKSMINRLHSFEKFVKDQISDINHDIQELLVNENWSIDELASIHGLDKVTLATLISESDGYGLPTRKDG